MEKKKFWPYQDSNSDPSVVQPVGSRYTDCATPAQASLSIFNILSSAECEYDDGLQTEKHIFWDCKLYEDKRATIMDTSSENSKKGYPKSVTEFLRLEEKRYVQGVCCFINNIPKYI
jgi:hypothetical protein